MTVKIVLRMTNAKYGQKTETASPIKTGWRGFVRSLVANVALKPKKLEVRIIKLVEVLVTSKDAKYSAIVSKDAKVVQGLV